jgi:hypothetical protein
VARALLGGRRHVERRGGYAAAGAGHIEVSDFDNPLSAPSAASPSDSIGEDAVDI